MNCKATQFFTVVACAVASCVGMTGCQSDPAIPQMEAEMRWVEDQYYALEDAYNQKCKELASCRMENQALRGDVTTNRRDGSAGEGEFIGPGEPTPVLPEVDENLPEPDSADGEEDNGVRFAPPTIEGVPGLPGAGDQPEPLRPLQGDDAEDDLDSLFSTQNTSSRRVTTDVADPEITHIVLNRRLTGGYDFDQKPGHEGLLVVVEPRNAAGQYVPLAGPLAIVLVDPHYSGEKSRIARWDLTKQQAAARLRKSLLGRGMHIELPWPGEPPKHKELRLYVRYTAADGRELKTEQTIEIEPIRELAQRWTPAADREQRMAARPPVNTLRPNSTPSTETTATTNAAVRTTEGVSHELPPPVSHQNSTPATNAGSGSPQWSPYR